MGALSYRIVFQITLLKSIQTPFFSELMQIKVSKVPITFTMLLCMITQITTTELLKRFSRSSIVDITVKWCFQKFHILLRWSTLHQDLLVFIEALID